MLHNSSPHPIHKILRRGCSALTSHLPCRLTGGEGTKSFGRHALHFSPIGALLCLAVRRGPSRHRRSRSSSLAASVAFATRLPPVIKIESGCCSLTPFGYRHLRHSRKHQYGVPGICSQHPQRQYRLKPGNVVCTPRSDSFELRFLLQHCRRHFAVDRNRLLHVGFISTNRRHSFSMLSLNACT